MYFLLINLSSTFTKYLLILNIFLIILVSSVFQAQGCSIFTITSLDDENVFFGSNKDHKHKYHNITAIWFNPGNESAYGAAYSGWYFPEYQWEGCPWYDLPMGGINTAGLCFDMNAVPPTDVNFNESKPSWPSKCYTVYTLEHCRTIDEVINLYKTYKFPDETPTRLQLHYADATGNAVVISTADNGSFAYTRMNSSNILVSTNFNLANPTAGGYPCSRYDTAVSMLELIKQENNFTIKEIANVLEAVHIEDPSAEDDSYQTLYSLVYDLKNKDIYVYDYYNFSECFTFNLENELQRGFHHYLIADLETNSSSSMITSESSQSQQKTTSTSVPAGGLLSIISLACLNVICYRKKRKIKFS